MDTKIIKENGFDFLVLKLKTLPKYARLYLSDDSEQYKAIEIKAKLNEVKLNEETIKVYKQDYKILKITD